MWTLLFDQLLLSFKVALGGSNNVPPTPQAKSGSPAQETKNDELPRGSSPTVSASEESISEFMSQVSGLIKYITFLSSFSLIILIIDKVRDMRQL